MNSLEQKINSSLNDRNPDYTQVVVWRATIVGEDRVKDFEEFFKDECNTRIKYIQELKTKPSLDDYGNSISGTGGRNDVLFFVHKDDISSFAIKRFEFNGEISWFEDVIDNEKGIYPEEIIDKYYDYATKNKESLKVSKPKL